MSEGLEQFLLCVCVQQTQAAGSKPMREGGEPPRHGMATVQRQEAPHAQQVGTK